MSVHAVPAPGATRALRIVLTLAALGGRAHAQQPAGTAPAGGSSPGAVPSPRIRLNQVGFDVREPKTAVVVAGDAARGFAVVDAARGDTAFAGTLTPPRAWVPSGEVVRRAEFGALVRPGRYVLTVAGVGSSAPFVVQPGAAREVARAAVKAFYYQRASTDLPARYAGRWARAAGHPDTAVLVHPSAAGPTRAVGAHVSSPRGWYDAGDYNKYVVNSGISTYTLFALADHVPAYAAALDTHIPESGNGLPDVLNEALWNLGWMRTMQDPADGGVYHKLTNAVFDPFVMPAAATTPRYVVQKSTAAALDFSATAAHAAVVLRRYHAAPSGLADSLVREALAAWTWARRHPDAIYDQDRMNAQFAPRVTTGTYGDGDVRDEVRWAASELYVATHADSFLVAAAPLAAPTPGVPSWGSVAMLGVYSLLDHRAELPAAFDTAALAARVLTPARALAARAGASAYGVAIDDPRDFIWGSNAVAANQGMLLIQAYRLTRDRALLDAAVANLDYILGRNATGYSFVTGVGVRPPRFPHHRPSAADGIAEPIPGLLVGGPNPGQQDHCPGYPSRVPALSYVDSTCAYAANEIAINWNAPFAYLAATVDALEGTVAAPPPRPGGS